jgi:hypothetical protein
MKVTRKVNHDMPMNKAVKRSESEEIAPSLRLRALPKEIEGLQPGADFEATIKGKCVGHECQEGKGEFGDGPGEGKTHHHYELEVHHFDHNGKGEKKKKSAMEETGAAMDKYDKDKAKEAEDKKKKDMPE